MYRNSQISILKSAEDFLNEYKDNDNRMNGIHSIFDEVSNTISIREFEYTLTPCDDDLLELQYLYRFRIYIFELMEEMSDDL